MITFTYQIYLLFIYIRGFKSLPAPGLSNLNLYVISMEASQPSPKPHLLDEDEKTLIASLPKKDGFSSLGQLYQFQGFWHSEKLLKGIISAQDNFQAKPTNIVLASFPKTGTTWLKALCVAIATRARFDDSTSPLLSRLPHDCMPYIEVDLVDASEFSSDIALPLVATHVPFTSLPSTVMATPGCKVVYIWRDPKDAFVSMWHFFSKIMVSEGQKPPPMAEAFELYCQGLVPNGPYWNHVVGYRKASLENPDRILVLKYEDVRTNTVRYVKKLADFIGYPFTHEEVRNGDVEKIASFCSLENMRELGVNKTGKHHFGHDMHSIDNSFFFRKGEIGDWRNCLTEEMGARLDKIMEDNLEIAGLKME